MKFEKRSGDGETPAPAPEDTPSTGKKPVVIYIMILFIVAFLLMALSFLMHQRSNSEVLGELQDSVTAMQEVQATQDALLALIAELNGRDDVDGILLQLPLPGQLSASACLLAIDPAKDVDGFHPENVGRLSLNLPGMVSCTPAGVIELLRRYNLPTRGKKAVVLGRSDIVGKPLALLLARPGEFGDATVTLCHSRTPDLAAECRSADFLFLAIGRPRLITGDMVREGAVIIDVGINHTDEGLCGDADFESVSRKAAAITPVPGGVGPMTIAMLLKNTVQAWESRA